MTGSEVELGKPQGSDERHGKLTYVSALRTRAGPRAGGASRTPSAAQALARVDGDTGDLELITDFIHTRQALSERPAAATIRR